MAFVKTSVGVTPPDKVEVNKTPSKGDFREFGGKTEYWDGSKWVSEEEWLKK